MFVEALWITGIFIVATVIGVVVLMWNQELFEIHRESMKAKARLTIEEKIVFIIYEYFRYGTCLWNYCSFNDYKDFMGVNLDLKKDLKFEPYDILEICDYIEREFGLSIIPEVSSLWKNTNDIILTVTIALSATKKS
jgi:acyl carrier protein